MDDMSRRVSSGTYMVPVSEAKGRVEEGSLAHVAICVWVVSVQWPRQPSWEKSSVWINEGK